MGSSPSGSTMSLLCKIGIHDWSGIITTDSRIINDTNNMLLALFSYYKELGEKTCRRCGKKEHLEKIGRTGNWYKP